MQRVRQSNFVRGLVFTIGLAFLAGCGGVEYTVIGTGSSAGKSDAEIIYPPQSRPQPSKTPSHGKPAKPVSKKPAIQQLLTQARSAQARGNYQSAAVTLEQALTIDNRNAELWLELARVRQQMGQRGQAINLAKRARQYGSGSIKRQAQRLIETLSL